MVEIMLYYLMVLLGLTKILLFYFKPTVHSSLGKHLIQNTHLFPCKILSTETKPELMMRRTFNLNCS